LAITQIEKALVELEDLRESVKEQRKEINLCYSKLPSKPMNAIKNDN
jgi:predicted RNase H-like nuclease